MALHGADARGDARTPRSREVGLRAVRAADGGVVSRRAWARPRRATWPTPTPTAPRAPAPRYFLVERDGEPAASCELLGFDGIGQVESVYTAAAHRGHGLASAVVRAAIAASRERGDDLVMIMADADDWPQRLYERLGFETVDAYRSVHAQAPVTVADRHSAQARSCAASEPRACRRPYPSGARRRSPSPRAGSARRRRRRPRGTSQAYGLLRGERVGEVGDPAGALVVEVGQLLRGERTAEAAAQLVVDLAGHALEHARAGRAGRSSRRRRPAAHWSDAVSNGTASRLARPCAFGSPSTM